MTAPQVTSMVSAAKVAPAAVPKRSSLLFDISQMLIRGSPATAGTADYAFSPLAVALVS